MRIDSGNASELTRENASMPTSKGSNSLRFNARTEEAIQRELKRYREQGPRPATKPKKPRPKTFHRQNVVLTHMGTFRWDENRNEWTWDQLEAYQSRMDAKYGQLPKAP